MVSLLSFSISLISVLLLLLTQFFLTAHLLDTLQPLEDLHRETPFPLSPALFTIFFDLLSRILSKSEAEKKIHGVKVSRTSPAISHLMYADDLIIYGRATVDEAEEISKCLQQFCDWSGQEINYGKSSVHFSRNVDSGAKNNILRILKMTPCTHGSKYLGLPFCKHSSRTAAFTEIIDKVRAKLAGWKAKALSFAGRSTLIQSVAQTLPSYTMQTYILPVGICKKIDGLLRDFWWGKDMQKKNHLYLKSWKKICVPKEAGGLGFRTMVDMNLALTTKLAWQLCTKPNKLWVLLLTSKYLKGLKFLDDSQNPARGSWIWNNILDCKSSLKNGICYWIGKDSVVRLKEDPWIPEIQGFKIPSDIHIPENLYYVRELMTPNGFSWNMELIYSVFPPHIAKMIGKISILDHT